MKTHAPTGEQSLQQTQQTSQPTPLITETESSFENGRSEAKALQCFQNIATDSPRNTQLKSMQSIMANSAVQQRLSTSAQIFSNKPKSFQRMEDEEPLQVEPAQIEAASEAPRQNNTGLPDNLKSGIENLSGMSMDHVTVHYNSDKPAHLQAHAYAQGSEIHVAPGQEQHLPHEAWHVVQQAQGRVKPTVQMEAGVPVNDDVGLENEADVMGAKSLNVAQLVLQREKNSGVSSGAVYQCMIFPSARVGLSADLDTANLVVAEQQLNQMADANLQAELNHVKRELAENGTTSGLLEGKTNDEKLLKITKKLLADGPNVPEKEAMGFFERRTAKAAVGGQPDVDPALVAAINIWVVGNPQTGVVWSALGNHLRGKIDISGYRDFGIQSYMLLAPPQQLIFDNANPTEPGLTMAYVALAQAAFTVAAQDLRAGLGNLPDFGGTSYRQSNLADNTVFNGKVATNDLIMDKTFWSTSILRGAGGAAGNWDSIGSIDHPIVYFVITGTTGKYIAKYAQTEGEQEVLFNDRVVFNVDRIVNLKNATFFVYLTEVPPPPGGTVIKNPFTGDPY